MHPKIYQEKGSKYLIHIRIKPKVGKTIYTETTNADWYLIISK